LTDVTGALALYPRYPAYEQVLAWVQEFVLQAHPHLGRPGAVCPRLAPAIRRNLVRLAAIRTVSTSVDEAYDIGLSLGALYRDLFPTPGEYQSGALLAVFPDLPSDAAGAFIDGGHARLRMHFVAGGLMIGEFHPQSPVASVHNPQLLVMRCPVPMFAVRALSRHDLLFLDRPTTPPDDRARYLHHLVQHVGAQLTRTDHDRIQRSLAAAGDPR
jgi:hypothetical protein